MATSIPATAGPAMVSVVEADQYGPQQVPADHEPPTVDPVGERARQQPEAQVGDGLQGGQ